MSLNEFEIVRMARERCKDVPNCEREVLHVLQAIEAGDPINIRDALAVLVEVAATADSSEILRLEKREAELEEEAHDLKEALRELRESVSDLASDVQTSAERLNELSREE